MMESDRQSSLGFLERLETIVRARIETPDINSYTAKLATSGIDRVAQKLGEEALEVALASVMENRGDELRNEVADLLYHLIVLLAVRDIPLSEVVSILEARHAARVPASTVVEQ